MAKVGAQRAAELTGKSKSTVQRSMNSGKLSYELDANGRRVIDVSELERVFGLKQDTTSQSNQMIEKELEKATQMLEAERMKMRIKSLEDQLFAAESQISDLKEQRDKWQKQADQVLITSQYSQKDAEKAREELRIREQRSQEKRQKMLEKKMQRFQAQNQNSVESDDDGFMNTLWKRVKGQR